MGEKKISARTERRSVNKSQISAYNKVVEEITVSDEAAHSLYITYLYNALSGTLSRLNCSGELMLGERAVLRLRVQKEALMEVRDALAEKITEVVGVGYKYAYLSERVKTCLGGREKKLLCAALIAADYEGDRVYIRRKIAEKGEFSIDGFYSFRLGALRDKWQRIVEYVPESFGGSDLKQFCDFLVGESKNKIYLKGNTVFGENFVPLRRSRLTGEEDAETEIMLSDAGFVYCLGEVEERLSDFLQKFYAERAIFS